MELLSGGTLNEASERERWGEPQVAYLAKEVVLHHGPFD